MNPVFLEEAIRLSREKMEADEGGPFGAVIVRDGRVVGRGWNRLTSTLDPTAHAEVVAIRDACSREKTFSLAGCEIYSSCEPCPLCLAAIYWARIEAIHFAADQDDAAAAGFDDRAFYEEFAKPGSERRIPADQSMQQEARAVLAAWSAKPDRVRY